MNKQTMLRYTPQNVYVQLGVDRFHHTCVIRLLTVIPLQILGPAATVLAGVQQKASTLQSQVVQESTLAKLQRTTALSNLTTDIVQQVSYTF